MFEKQHVCSLRHRQNELWLIRLQNSAKILVPPVYQDLSTCCDWSVEKDIDDLPIRLKGNAKHTSHNFIESIEGPEQ